MADLLKQYILVLSLPDCSHSAAIAGAQVDLSDDISEVLPYLNAILPRATYYPNIPALVFEDNGKLFALRRQEVSLSPVQNEAEACRVMDWLVEIINVTWERRSEIEPSYRVPKQIKMLDVYRLLPGGNCRACGEATCLAFSTKVAKRELDASACTPLFDPHHEEKRQKLFQLVNDAEQ